MIETEDLSKQFVDFWAVDGVTFQVHPGQILALLGQNGAGKTTTIRMLTALLSPTRGWARVAGYDVVAQANQVRAEVGVLTEQHSLYMRMTAEEYLDFFGQLYRLDAITRRKRCQHLLDYFGLAEVARRRIGEYSKGMRQKLALARALIHEPPVLLLDEPTSYLDITHQIDIIRILKKMNQDGITIVLLSHDINLTSLVCNRLLLLSDGKMVACDSPEKIISCEIIKQVYKITPHIIPHPDTKKPQIILPG